MNWLISFNLWTIYKELMAVSKVCSWGTCSTAGVSALLDSWWSFAFVSMKLGSTPWTALCRYPALAAPALNYSESAPSLIFLFWKETQWEETWYFFINLSKTAHMLYIISLTFVYIAPVITLFTRNQEPYSRQISQAKRSAIVFPHF